jgi:hypothetical protein
MVYVEPSRSPIFRVLRIKPKSSKIFKPRWYSQVNILAQVSILKRVNDIILNKFQIKPGGDPIANRALNDRPARVES